MKMIPAIGRLKTGTKPHGTVIKEERKSSILLPETKGRRKSDYFIGI